MYKNFGTYSVCVNFIHGSISPDAVIPEFYVYVCVRIIHPKLITDLKTSIFLLKAKADNQMNTVQFTCQKWRIWDYRDTHSFKSSQSWYEHSDTNCMKASRALFSIHSSMPWCLWLPWSFLAEGQNNHFGECREEKKSHLWLPKWHLKHFHLLKISIFEILHRILCATELHLMNWRYVEQRQGFLAS